MIAEALRYYGCVLHQIVDTMPGTVGLKKFDDAVPGFFLVSERLPLHVKYSTARKGPWGFNFQPSHRRALDAANADFGGCVIVLVCAKDGMVAIDYDDLYGLFEGDGSLQENVSVRRGHREMYELRGPKGVLGRKLGRNSLAPVLEANLGK